MKVEDFILPLRSLTLIVISISMGEYILLLHHGQWASKYKGGKVCQHERINADGPLTMEELVYYRRTISTK